MAVIDLQTIEGRMRLKYEWGRTRQAMLGFAPVLVVVAISALVGERPASALTFGAVLFASGTVLLWYGRDLRRAVLPGVVAGIVPLTLALLATRFGHVCTADGCTTLCVPACTVGGLIAGLTVAAVGHRAKHGFGFWGAASGLALLTGAMGCACVGYSGVAGLGIGFTLGVVPILVRRLSGQR